MFGRLFGGKKKDKAAAEAKARCRPKPQEIKEGAADN